MTYQEAVKNIEKASSNIETLYKVFLRKYGKHIRRTKPAGNTIRLSIPAGAGINLFNLFEVSIEENVSINIDLPIDSPFLEEFVKFFRQ